MANPLKSMQRTREEYRSMDRLDRRRFWSDSILNNALYILMFVFVVYTAIKNKNFLAPGSIVNILSLVAASLPMALGIAGCIVLTGTDLSGGRVVGLTSAIAAHCCRTGTNLEKVLLESAGDHRRLDSADDSVRRAYRRDHRHGQRLLLLRSSACIRSSSRWQRS